MPRLLSEEVLELLEDELDPELDPEEDRLAQLIPELVCVHPTTPRFLLAGVSGNIKSAKTGDAKPKSSKAMRPAKNQTNGLAHSHNQPCPGSALSRPYSDK